MELESVQMLGCCAVFERHGASKLLEACIVAASPGLFAKFYSSEHEGDNSLCSLCISRIVGVLA